MAAEEGDDELVSRAAIGDKAAFTRLVARHQRRLLALVNRMTGNRAAAEDIVQEVFTRAWVKAPSWQMQELPGGGYAAWLSRVAVNLCVDAHRKTRPTVADALDKLRDPTAPADVTLLQRETTARVNAAVAALPERQRTAIGLFYDGELSNAQGAAAMGITVGAFELLLVRARRTLRLAVQEA